ncbi:hypothetical protein [Parachlamydia acanthamoebae]|uniref:hypothetical protein n=1 Tax=Parachlamydia acanthamoebae TaxID=83552 RepID=UPI0001C172BF|nr:hypothetical protein [Parachlamydia acanthamoebae]EFB41444.1 hypothetical protein pah_c034o002 [Parachlamydia acanthamoebae str. Hall's coccus]
MRILDQNADKSLNDILIYLTYDEALELKSSLDDLLERPSNNHSHISNKDFSKELTVCIYDENNLTGFNERSTTLIKNDE